MAFEVTSYPPVEFCNKYRKYLSPNGILIPPKQVFGNKALGHSAEDALRKAFRITVKKLKKLRQRCANCSKDCDNHYLECAKCQTINYCGEGCQKEKLESHGEVCDKLKMEKIDQIVECLPLPFALGKDILRGKGGPISSWSDWFRNHTYLEDRIRSSLEVIQRWWEFAGIPKEEAVNLQSSLERIVSNIFSTVLTIGHAPYWAYNDADAQRPSDACNMQDNCSDFNKIKLVNKGKEIKIHLIGADQPEVSAVNSGLIQISSRILKSPLMITLVAPDLVRHPETSDWSILKPHQISPEVKVSAYAGLYHEYWEKYIGGKSSKGKIGKPDVCIAIHPGVHTTEMFELWRPTLELLAKEEIPVVMTTYNKAEFEQTIQVISSLDPIIKLKGENPYGSLQWKQTPYEPDHVWASNSYLIVIQNKLRNCFL